HPGADPGFLEPARSIRRAAGQRRQPGDARFGNIPTPEKALSAGGSSRRSWPADRAHGNERSAYQRTGHTPTIGEHVQQPGAHPTAERASNNNTKIRIPKEFASRGGTVNPRRLLERHLRAVERAAADPQVLSPGAPRAVAALRALAAHGRARPLKPLNLRNVCRSTAEGSREWMPHGYGIHFADGRTVTVHGPRTSIMGDGASAEAGRVLRSWGLEKGVRVVLVADAEVARLGLTAPALDALQGEGFAVEVFSDIAGEPDLDMARS